MTWGQRLHRCLLNQYVAHVILKFWVYLCVPTMTAFVAMLSTHVDLFFVFLSVAHPQDPHHPSEKPVIHCHKCGELCKGEVLRVQTKHFHIRCFTCKGMDPPASWLCAMSLPWRLPHPLNSTPVHQMVNECAPRPWNCSPSLIWEWIKLKGETELPPPPRPAVHCLWVFTEVPDPRRGA